jgi:hypothetical protein
VGLLVASNAPSATARIEAETLTASEPVSLDAAKPILPSISLTSIEESDDCKLRECILYYKPFVR